MKLDVARLLAQIGGPPSPGCIRWLKRRHGIDWHLAEHDPDPAQLQGLMSYWRVTSDLKPGDYLRAGGVEGVVTDVSVEPEKCCPCRERVRLEDENKSLREQVIQR